MRIGSLFSGAGGLDMAVAEVFSGEIVWHAEIDKAASKVLAHRFPGVPNLGDISAVDWADVPAVDVLCGGFPCQDVSAAGKRAGIKDGTRSGLWAVFADAIDALRPQWVVIENVRGLLSATAHRTVEDDEQSGDMESATAALGDGAGRPVLRAAGAVLGDLADLGYDAQWATVAAADVGAPHRRERVFIVATDTAAGEHANDQLAGRDGPQLAITGRRSHRSNAGSPDPSGDGWDEGRAEPAGLQRGLDAALGGDEPGVALLPTPRSQDANGYQQRPDADIGNNGRTVSLADRVTRLPSVLLPTPNAQDGNGGGRYSSEGHQSTLPGEVRLLPTPTQSDGTGGGIRTGLSWEGTTKSTGDGGNSRLRDVVGLLLPTPRTSDTNGAGLHGDGGMDLRTTVTLLPTPTTMDDREKRTTHAAGNLTLQGAICGVNPVDAERLNIAAKSANWGKYAPAIARWEAIVGPAPAPTEPNKNGNPRLSAAFSEWLMGWPAGWVTDPAIGISRNDQLRIVGNGVCPQQAAAALRYLLAVTA